MQDREVAMTADKDLRGLVYFVSAVTLGLWALATALIAVVFLS
jgi:hypothetical protein